MTHFVSSRDGLFTFDKKLTKILDGRFFGMVHRNGLHYICGYTGQRGMTRDMRGHVLSFSYSNGQVSNVKEQLTGIDDGCHQMTVYKDHLYILETYLQRIVKVRIDSEGNLVKSSLEYITPWKHAVQMDIAKDHSENEGYLHVNAITVQDGRFFVMCPLLKNMNPEKLTSKIQVFSEDWKLLDEYQLKRWFCHDIVPLGHEIFFCDALNTICKLNLVSREVIECVRLRDTPPDDNRSICRGLSIGQDGQTLVSSIYNDWVKIVDVSCDGYYGTSLECSATFITRIDGMDYNNVNCPLRKQCVVTLQRDLTPFFKEQGPITDDIFEKVQKREWTTQTVYSPNAPTLQEFLNPPCKDDESVYIGASESINTTDHSEELKSLLSSNVFTSIFIQRNGDIFFYPKGSGRGWHNNETQLYQRPHTSFRTYSVRTTGGTFFFYKHPVSGKIHAVHDIDKSINVFHLTPRPNSFWHAIGSFQGNRLSIGFRTGILGVLGLGLSQKEITDILF